ncbi:MAG TPA: L,D-transpeptidase family protein, partial [Actinomycetota bacterium]|nr:L,D-transpeptidase family protein [Actinomycetota bacterium]
MNGLSGRQVALWTVGVVAAVAATWGLVMVVVNEPAPAPAAPVAREVVSLQGLVSGTASVLVKSMPPPPPPPPPPAPLQLAPAPVAIAAGAPVPAPANPVGAEALALEQRLSDLGYLVGKVDGVIDGATKHGITAFQKVENLPRNGVADAPTLQRLASAQKPAPKFNTPPDHWEVDIPRQVVFMVRGGQVAAISPTSTGNNKKFTSQGYTRRAVTPNGQFQIQYKRNGWLNAPLGRLYRPAYFNGGIALHG